MNDNIISMDEHKEIVNSYIELIEELIDAFEQEWEDADEGTRNWFEADFENTLKAILELKEVIENE